MTFSNRPQPDAIAPGEESAWDYPRPPRLEATAARLRVVLGGVTVAETTAGFRVLETSHPPNYYFPPESVAPGVLQPAAGSSFCEWKGRARYYTLAAGGRVAEDAAWAYESPSPAFEPITGFLAFYADRADACYVDDELVVPQPGGFYGGWITTRVRGPFKGGPGTRGW